MIQRDPSLRARSSCVAIAQRTACSKRRAPRRGTPPCGRNALERGPVRSPAHEVAAGERRRRGLDGSVPRAAQMGTPALRSQHRRAARQTLSQPRFPDLWRGKRPTRPKTLLVTEPAPPWSSWHRRDLLYRPRPDPRVCCKQPSYVCYRRDYTPKNGRDMSPGGSLLTLVCVTYSVTSF